MTSQYQWRHFLNTGTFSLEEADILFGNRYRFLLDKIISTINPSIAPMAIPTVAFLISLPIIRPATIATTRATRPLLSKVHSFKILSFCSMQ